MQELHYIYKWFLRNDVEWRLAPVNRSWRVVGGSENGSRWIFPCKQQVPKAGLAIDEWARYSLRKWRVPHFGHAWFINPREWHRLGSWYRSLPYGICVIATCCWACNTANWFCLSKCSWYWWCLICSCWCTACWCRDAASALSISQFCLCCTSCSQCNLSSS
jgi:hypothetical protein